MATQDKATGETDTSRSEAGTSFGSNALHEVLDTLRDNRRLLVEGAVSFAANFALSKVTFGVQLGPLLSRAGGLAMPLSLGMDFVPGVPQGEGLTGFLADTLAVVAAGAAGGRLGQAVFHSRRMHMGLPTLTENGLPQGTWKTDWQSFQSAYFTNPTRTAIGERLHGALYDINQMPGPKRVHIGGSFVRDKMHPGDFDLIVSAKAPQFDSWLTKAPSLDRFDAKQFYGGDIIRNGRNNERLDFFRVNRREAADKPFNRFLQRSGFETGTPVGVVELDLSTLPAQAPATSYLARQAKRAERHATSDPALVQRFAAALAPGRKVPT